MGCFPEFPALFFEADKEEAKREVFPGNSDSVHGAFDLECQGFIGGEAVDIV